MPPGAAGKRPPIDSSHSRVGERHVRARITAAAEGAGPHHDAPPRGVAPLVRACDPRSL